VIRHPRESTAALIGLRGAAATLGIRRRAASAGGIVLPEIGVYFSEIPTVAFQIPGYTWTHAGDACPLIESDFSAGVAEAALAARVKADPFKRSLRFIISHLYRSRILLVNLLSTY
jgi:hypothetical protein